MAFSLPRSMTTSFRRARIGSGAIQWQFLFCAWYCAKVFFDFDKSDLRPEAVPVLNTIADTVRLDPPDGAVLVAGHTDAVGSRAYNQRLGLKRAKAVPALARQGVGSAQVFVASFGKAVPIARNDRGGRARNRRVQFLFAAQPELLLSWLAQQHTDVGLPTAIGSLEPCKVAVEKIVYTPPPKITMPRPGPPTPVPEQGHADVVIRHSVADIELRTKVWEFRPPE
jgi:hypothetical protein